MFVSVCVCAVMVGMCAVLCVMMCVCNVSVCAVMVGLCAVVCVDVCVCVCNVCNELSVW